MKISIYSIWFYIIFTRNESVSLRLQASDTILTSLQQLVTLKEFTQLPNVLWSNLWRRKHFIFCKRPQILRISVRGHLESLLRRTNKWESGMMSISWNIGLRLKGGRSSNKFLLNWKTTMRSLFG